MSLNSTNLFQTLCWVFALVLPPTALSATLRQGFVLSHFPCSSESSHRECVMDIHAGLFPVPPRASGSPTCSLSCSWEDTPLNSERPGPPTLEVFYVEAVSEPATISSRCLVASEKCSLHTRAATGLRSWPPFVRGGKCPSPTSSRTSFLPGDPVPQHKTVILQFSDHSSQRPRQCPRQSELPRDRPVLSDRGDLALPYCEHRRMVGFSFQT